MEQGEDATLLHAVDTAFFDRSPSCVAVAVSGGGDSMALLHLFWRWARQVGVDLRAVSVDHGLRPEAKDETALVAELCAAKEIPHSVLHWDARPDGGNLMAAARDARYRLIGAWARKAGVQAVALGHTADDVAETFLMRLARRAGVDGLAAMRPRFERDGMDWARPLWQVERAELRDYLRRHGLDWAEDPTNDDPAFERTRVRRALGGLAEIGIDTETLKDVAFQMYLARGALEHYTAELARAHVQQEHGDLILPLESPERGTVVPGEILFRLRRAALAWVGGGSYLARGEALIETEIALAEGKASTLAGCLITPVDGARRWERRWRVSREYNAVKDLVCPVGAVWDGRWRVAPPEGEAPPEDAEIRALGEAGIAECPDWRATGLPRTSLLSSPAVWSQGRLIAAPLADPQSDWAARIVADFGQTLLSH